MDIQPFFTEEEKKQFFSKYKQLLRHLYSFLKKEDLSKMKELMKRVVALDCYGRDKNGINGLLRNIDTALISTVEIGLKRTSVIALLLYRPVMKKIITLEEVKATFDADVTLIISRLLKTSALYARNTAVDSENFHKLLFSFAEDVRVIRRRSETAGNGGFLPLRPACPPPRTVHDQKRTGRLVAEIYRP